MWITIENKIWIIKRYTYLCTILINNKMKKVKQLNEITREFLMCDYFNAINQQNEITNKLNSKDLDCMEEYYLFDLLLLNQKIRMMEEIIVNNKF